MFDFSKQLQVALNAARAGARIIQNDFIKVKDFQVKDHLKGLVTETDLAAEKAILDILKKQSTYGILSEESGSLDIKKGPIWVVDPLDGTNNFARSLPFFAVSVGLVDSNEILVGVIIDPLNKKEYYATKGGGAFCNDEKIIHSVFNNEYIPMIFLNHGYAKTDRAKFKELSNRLACNFNILKLGTTVLELCYVASGTVDAFIASGGEIWDFAAGIVITQEAGCKFSNWKGKEWDGKNSHLLISKPEIYEEIKELIKHLE